ncbi:MAG: polysaccharide biosynthesis tyrosine autokinase [Desulfobacteraceae bacterium]|jgi:succinoglycan biosynthesis transport protein ExoP|nr:polysaccharide biosynthesis tyrosine autokinase [Desulfobacteraceae bacterium]
MYKEDENPIKQYLNVVLRRKNIILLIFLVCLPFVLIKAFSGIPVYKATAKLMIKKNYNPGFISQYQFYDPYFLKTQTQLITSSKVATKVAETLNLDETYNRYFENKQPASSILNKVFNWFQNLFSFAKTPLKSEINDPVNIITEKPDVAEGQKNDQEKIATLSQKVRSGIAVESDMENGNIVNVSFTSTSPIFAATVVNTVASAYRQFLMGMKMETSTQSLEWMKSNTDSERAKLEASERKLREYKKQHDIYTVGDQEAIFPKKIAQISSNLTQAQANVNELEAVYQEIRRITPEEALNLPLVADNPTVTNLRQQLIQKEQEINTLSKSLGPKHPKMIRAKKDLVALNEKLDNEIVDVIQSVKNRYELARQKAKKSQALLDEAKQNAALMSDKLIQFEILNRDVEVHRLLYDRLLSRIKEFNITETQLEVEVWVIENAETPKTPITKGPKRALMLGILLSLAAGIGLAFFLDYMDNTLKTAEDTEERLGIPILGMVPLIKKEDESHIETIVSKNPGSTISEAYKAIRTALLLSSPDASPEIILVSSMNQGAGKTVTSLNLAIALAQSEKKVLLVDGDMRRSRIHKIFDIDNTSGLSTYLAGQSDIMTFPSGSEKYLDIAPAGPVPPNPSELLSFARLNTFIQTVKQQYDFIIIDSPPLLNVSDAHLISKAVEQTIIVARSGVSTYESVARAYNMLTNINSSVLGLIINAVDIKKENYYYSRYYGSYGYYKNNYTGT